jgi:hypothetical protein
MPDHTADPAAWADLLTEMERATVLAQGDKLRAMVDALRVSLPCQCARCCATAMVALGGAFASVLPDDARPAAVMHLHSLMDTFASARQGVALQSAFEACTLSLTPQTDPPKVPPFIFPEIAPD